MKTYLFRILVSIVGAVAMVAATLLGNIEQEQSKRLLDVIHCILHPFFHWGQ